ncbi:MAG: hypothetical protein QXE80_08215 [Pyrobaculum sp.]
MSWVFDVVRAREVLSSGGFVAVTHGGVAHPDDTIAAALLYRRGAEAVYRVNSVVEILDLSNVILFDVGDSWGVGGRFVVLDHHGVSDPVDEPSSVVQVMCAVDARPAPAVLTHIHYVDLFDRFGPSVRRLSGPYGHSLLRGVTAVFSKERGAVRDVKFLELLAEAFESKSVYDLGDYREAFRVVERLDVKNYVEKFPRSFWLLGLMLRAVDDVEVVYSRDAVETGFGIDFGGYAVLAVPELERYVVEGLRLHFAEVKKAVDAVASGRYVSLRRGEVWAVVVEDYVSPSAVWNALLDLEAVSGPGVVVVRDLRTPGGYTVWRPDVFRDRVDLRRLEGGDVVFRHVGGFMAVVRGLSGVDVANYVLERL